MSVTIVNGIGWTERCCGCGREQVFHIEESFEITKGSPEIEEQKDAEMEARGWALGYCAYAACQRIAKDEYQADMGPEPWEVEP